MKTVLVTGCMGFIGSNLVPKLLNAGMNVVGFDNLSQPSIDPTGRMKTEARENWINFKFYKVDIKDRDTMITIAANHKIDAVVHLAAMGSVPRSFAQPRDVVMNNELGFVSVMEMCATIGIKKLVFASSSSVYGDSKAISKVEGQEGNLLSPYALSKKMNEEFAWVWGQAMGITFAALRFFNVYGPGQLPNSPYSAVIPRFICEVRPKVYGDGETARDFTYVDDVCIAIHRALNCQRSAIMNVCGGNSISLNTILEKLDKREVTTYEPARTGDIKFSLGDPTRAKELIGFKTKFSIDQGLIRTKLFYERAGLIQKEDNGSRQTET
jgi:UDP-N-acetylglucosamine 4-epimerase